MQEHLTRELFRAIQTGWRNPGDLAAIAMAHLFELCPRCRKEFESWRSEGSESLVSLDGHGLPPDLDRVGTPAAANDGGKALEPRTDAARNRAHSRAEQLLALSPEQQFDWVRNESEKHSGLLLAEALIEECRRRTPGFPYEGKAIALLARVVLQHAPTSPHAAELYALALARLANAVRVIGDLPRADQILADARYFLVSNGTGDRRVRSEIDSLEGSLRIGQFRPEEAAPCLLRALMTFRLEGCRHGSAAVLVKLGKAFLRMGDLQRAEECHLQVERELAIEPSQYLLRTLRLNQSSIHCRKGDIDRALDYWSRARSSEAAMTDPNFLLRASWTRAHIYGAGGSLASQLELLFEVREAFAASGMVYDAAIASLEVGQVIIDQGSGVRARPYLDEALSVFRALKVPKRITAAEIARERAAAH